MNGRGGPLRPDIPPPWRPRFGIGTLMLVTVVCSVTAAAGSYLARSLQTGSSSAKLTFILFTLVAPVALLLVVSVLWQIVHRQKRRP